MDVATEDLTDEINVSESRTTSQQNCKAVPV